MPRRLTLLVALVLSLVTSVLAAKPRARDLGVPFDGKSGTFNAITDVAGVEDLNHSRRREARLVQPELVDAVAELGGPGTTTDNPFAKGRNDLEENAIFRDMKKELIYYRDILSRLITWMKLSS